jgi:DNA repair photolyase
MKPIYKPAGRALEYSPDALALNIYTGCPHGCFYCFAPTVLKKTREEFHNHVEPRNGIVEAVKRQLDYGYININNKQKDDSLLPYSILLKDKLIHLCFTCDPYPTGYDTVATREIIAAIKESGNHVQILTKGKGADRDFDLLNEYDWYGVTISGNSNQMIKQEPNAERYEERLMSLVVAKKAGINTWASFEPVCSTETVYDAIAYRNYIDLYRIGKLNYHKSDINWGAFGRKCERLCKKHDKSYYIKDDLRKEMEKGGNE